MALFSSRSFVSIALLLSALFVTGFSQSASTNLSKRRLVRQTDPDYPRLARSMSLEGIVRLEVLVSPDGAVKTADIKGGHPVLVQAAVTAVRLWKWERAPYESRELVEVKFARE